ncbi:hypothetical protein FE773_05420 [Caminibacter mediatlanticus TB-2]|uniref:Lipoprotein n=1 Tax=Caminibacter mediatlanticus TB-2 TaxID=391592 RepID=A0ABX5VBX0_9BACT|nr:hypothetical protein [Caminibacter mediatlanticus]QCT94635.1 hypothetical protein FE773_05420 [Caminibacter mediatlanticus TB-2]
MKKSLLFLIISLLILGCANKSPHISTKTQNNKNLSYKLKSKYYLYMSTQSGMIVNNINNNNLKEKYFVRLNDLKPYGYKNKIYCTGWIYYWARNYKCNCDKNIYDKKKHYNVGFALLLGGTTFGLGWLVFGIPHYTVCNFNDNKFFHFVNNKLTFYKIDRNKIIDKYSNLVDKADLLNKKTILIYNKYLEKYSEFKRKTIKEKYNDKIGFLSKNDHINLKITNYIEIPKRPSLKRRINEIFPCYTFFSNKNCMNQFASTSAEIEKMVKNYVYQLQEGDKNLSFIKYSYNKGIHKYDNNKGKILYYNIKIDKKASTVIYTIYRTDFYDVIPNYAIKDKYIKIEELQNGNIKIKNLTNKFLYVSMLSIYFNNHIVNYPANLNLAPNSEFTTYIKGFVNEATRLHDLVNSQGNDINYNNFYMLKNVKNKNQKIIVGLAVKYKIVGTDKYRTLYKKNRVPIETLIKNKI